MRLVGSLTQQPGYVSDRDADRFQRARRLVDQEPSVLAGMDSHQLMNDGVDVPVRKIRCAWQNGVEDLPDEVAQIGPQQRRKCARSFRILAVIVARPGICPWSVSATDLFPVTRREWPDRLSEMSPGGSVARSPSTRAACSRSLLKDRALPFNALSRSRHSDAFSVVIFFGFPLSLTVTGASSISLTSVVKLSAPLGRPRGFPHCPGFHRLCGGGLLVANLLIVIRIISAHDPPP